MALINQLRIGNYISPLGVGIDRVEFIDARDNTIECENFSERPIEDYEPIPLTEELLLNFGFEFRTDSGFNGWYSKPILGESIRIFEIENKWFKYNSATTVIKYVHQLQNLYFALTGEELKLN